MDDSNIVNDGLLSKGSSNIDASKYLDTAPLPEEKRDDLSPKGHILVNQDVEKEAFQEKIGRHICGLLCQEIKSFLKQPISYVIKKAYIKEHLPFVLIMALATFLRFYRFVSLPMGFQHEEVSVAYESYALILHGTDRWGNYLPVYFPTWGSGANALLNYLNVPFVKVFGLTTFSERFPNALLGVLAVAVLYAFVKRWYGRRTALIAAFFLATNPWHIMMSRWILESNQLPFFLLLGVTSLSYCYTSNHSRILIPFSLFFIAYSLYAYVVSIFIILTFLVLYFSLVGPKTLWQNKWSVLGSWLIFFLIASPFFLFLLDNFILHRTPWIVQHLPFSVPLLIANRFNQIGGGGDVLTGNIQFLMNGFRDGNVWNMASNFSPLGLLDMTVASVLGISSSQFGLLSIPLLPALGIYYSIKKYNVHASVFLILLISIMPIFFIFPLNINRVNAIFIPLIALSAIGIGGLSHSISNKDLRRIVISLILIAVAICNSIFCFYYFNNYNNDSKESFYPGLDVALAHARSSADVNEPIYVSDSIVGSYWYVLLFFKVDPVDFRHHSQVATINGAYIPLNYKNYYFDPNASKLRSVPSFVALLKDNEGLSCSSSEILYSEDMWTVERCFN